MFETSTVFVLGAGVSAPFGFPVGRQMRGAICEGRYRFGDNEVTTIPREALINVLQAVNPSALDLKTIGDFIDAFFEVGLYSIDAWLEANPQFLEVGKAAITTVIAKAECCAMDGGASVDQDWFAWLWNQMWTAQINDLRRNKVHFVTFNYDRLLEWNLQRQIKYTYLNASSKEHQAAFDFFMGRIVHVHGMIGGTYPPGNKMDSFGLYELDQIHDSNLFKSIVDPDLPEAVRRLSEPINIVCEGGKGINLVEKARTFIHEKNARVVFLGFSFDRRNIAKLKLEKYLEALPKIKSRDPERRLDEARIIATSMGLGRAEVAKVKAMFRQKIELGPSHMDAVAFCRDCLQTGG